MKKIIGLVVTLLLSVSSFAFNQRELEEHLSAMIGKVQDAILQGQPFTAFGGDYLVVAKILIEDNGKIYPNGNLSPVDEHMLGVSINLSFLNMTDNNAQLFALAHELGHGFSQKLLTDIDCQEASGIATEVVADLGAVKVLQLMGIGLDSIDSAIANWRRSMIFNVSKSGDHPAGQERYAFIHTFITMLKSGAEFRIAARKIIYEDIGANCS